MAGYHSRFLVFTGQPRTRWYERALHFRYRAGILLGVIFAFGFSALVPWLTHRFHPV